MATWPSKASTRAHADLAFRNRLRGFWVWWLLALLTIVGVSAIIIGASQTKSSDELWLEIAKGGVQVVGVGVLGGALALTWQDVQARRERRSKRSDKILAELVSMVALYNKVKAVRRTLRSLGLDLNTYRDPEQRRTAQETALLTKRQAQGFHEQMLILNGLQLEFESKLKQFAQTNFLDTDTPNVVTQLGLIENHLNHVLTLWEESGWTIREGTPLVQVSNGLTELFRVRDHLRPGVSDPMKEITRLINEHVFGKATRETEAAFERIQTKNRDLENKSDGVDERTAQG